MERANSDISPREREMIEKSYTRICENRFSNFVMYFIIGGVSLIFIYLIIAGGYLLFKSDSIRGYSGQRPKFEDYEYTIMSRLFDDGSPIVDSDQIVIVVGELSSNKREYVQVATPQDFDYTSLQFEKYSFGNGNSRVHYHNGLEKTEMYLTAKEEANRLFNEELKRRDSLVIQLILKVLAIGLLIDIVFCGLMLCWRREICHDCKEALRLVREGKYTYKRGKMIGRESHHSRNSYSAHIEVETEAGNEKITVDQFHHDRFKASAPCMIIELKDYNGWYSSCELVFEALYADDK